MTAVLYHRVMTNTHKSFWLDAQDLLKSRAGIKQHCVGMSQACVFFLSKTVLSLNNHTHLPARENILEDQMLNDTTYDIHLTMKHISTGQYLGYWHSGLI